MKSPVLLLIILVFLTASCNRDKEPQFTSIEGNWNLDEALLKNVSYADAGNNFDNEPDFYTPILYDKGTCVWHFYETGDIRFKGNSIKDFSNIESYIVSSSSDKIIFYTANNTQLSFDIVRYTSNELVLKKEGVPIISIIDGTEYTNPKSAITLFFTKI